MEKYSNGSENLKGVIDISDDDDDNMVITVEWVYNQVSYLFNENVSTNY